MRTTALSVTFAGLLLAATVGQAQNLSAAPSPASTPRERATFQPPPNMPKHAPDRLLVRFRPGTPKFRAEAAHAAVQARVLRTFKAMPDLQLVSLPEGRRVEAALNAYRKDPAVLYAEPDYVLHVLQNPVTPNDPRFGELWGLQKIQAREAWGLSTGSPQVVVAVIDTGIDYNHEDLNANLFRNPLDCNSNGIDDDGNGFVDDCYGIDTFNDDPDPMDDFGHGTHVAGTIGAMGNNGVGVVGVNWHVQLVACKFIGSDGFGYTSGAITCLEYIAALKDAGVNIVATNNSWGGDDFSQALFEAIDAHRQRGILFIAAAGNAASNNDTFAFYPADYYLPNVIAVGATNSNDNRADFSNYGRRSVHLGAPGVDVLSTTPGNTYDTFSGTSMATPHVTGVAALLAAQDPLLDWKAIKNLILAGGDTLPPHFDGEIWRVPASISRKRLNAYGAMTCTNSTVLSRLQPRTSVITTSPGLVGPVDLAVLHINCVAPNGNVTVLVDGGGETGTLLDDGLGTDQEADDGIYSGQWLPPGIGSHSLTIPNAELVVNPDDGSTAVVDDVVSVQVLSPYRFSTEVGFNYRNITGTELPLGDDDSGLIAPGFPILFGGGSFNTLFVNSNGNISFTASFSGFFNKAIPTPGTPTLVAPFWDDLLPPTPNSGVFWEVTGSAPNRELVIEWRDMPHVFDYCGGDGFDTGVKFQVVFFEGSSDILFNYADVTFGPPCEFADLGASATVGVQVAPQVGTQFSFNTPTLADNTAILWTLGAPTPAITRISPFTAATGDPGFTLKVSGSNFIPGSVVRWNGADRPTSFVSSNEELTVTISASDLAVAGTVQVTVFNSEPGGSSNQFAFTIYGTYPIPSLTAINPSVVSAPADPFTLTVTGTGFVSSSVVRWNGADRATTVLSSTQAQAEIQFPDAADGGFVQVTVFNPGPGGGVSNPLTLTVENPAPLIDFISPAAVAPGADFTLTVVSGVHDCADPGNDRCISTFVPSSVVSWNGADRPTLYLNADRLEAAIPASDVAAPGTAEITVFNPAPGGGTSNAVQIEIVPPPPNDNFADALVISTLPFTHTVDTRTATTEPSEPRQTCINLVDQNGNPVDFVSPHTVWYKFTPSTTMTITANTAGSDFIPFGQAPTLSVWTGSAGSLTPVTCSNHFSPDGFKVPEVSFQAAAGTTRYFFITSYPYPEAPGGTLVFNVAGGEAVDFTLAAACQGGNPPCNSPTMATITVGQSVSFNITGTPVPSAPYSNPITVTCVGLPARSTCTFNPSNTLNLNAGAQTITMTINTTGSSARLAPPFGERMDLTVYAFWLGVPGLALFGLGLAGRGREKRRLVGFLALLGVLLVMSSLLVACGGGGMEMSPPTPNPGTPPGTHTVSVAATAGTLQRSVNITVVVQ